MSAFSLPPRRDSLMFFSLQILHKFPCVFVNRASGVHVTEVFGAMGT